MRWAVGSAAAAAAAARRRWRRRTGQSAEARLWASRLAASLWRGAAWGRPILRRANRRVVVAGAVLRAELRLQVPPRLGHARCSLQRITLLAVVRPRRRVVVARDREHAAVAPSCSACRTAARGCGCSRTRAPTSPGPACRPGSPRTHRPTRAASTAARPRATDPKAILVGGRSRWPTGRARWRPPQLVRLHRRLLGARRRRQHGEQRAPRGHGGLSTGGADAGPAPRARLMVHAAPPRALQLPRAVALAPVGRFLQGRRSRGMLDER